jgi:hypothetical protein
MTPIVQGFFYLVGLIYMKPDYEILPHHCPQITPVAGKPAGKDEGTKICRRGKLNGGSFTKGL